MMLLTERLKKISVFAYILLALLAFNLVFNLNSAWYGISLIVRIYVYVFCFYLVFSFSTFTAADKNIVPGTGVRFPGKAALFVQARVIPFLIIFCVILVYILIENVNRTGWPLNALVKILYGRHLNLIVYSLFLLYVLKMRKAPYITIPVFLLLCVAYFYVTMFIDSAVQGGAGVQLVMYIKFVLFFFLLFAEFYGPKGIVRLVVSACIVSILLYAIFIGAFLVIYRITADDSYQKKQAGIQFLRMGFRFPFAQLSGAVLRTSDDKLFRELLRYARDYHMEFTYSDSDWKRLLFSGSADMADRVAEYLLHRNIGLTYDEIMAYAEARSMEPVGNLSNAVYFSRMASRLIAGNENDFLRRMGASNKQFTLWAIAVLGEQKDVRFIPVLIGYLPDIDTKLAEAAYLSLSNITGLDPREKLNRRLNDPDVLYAFKEFYLQTRKGR